MTVTTPDAHADGLCAFVDASPSPFHVCAQVTSDNRQRLEMAERMALNAPIQGSAADIIKVAMLGVLGVGTTWHEAGH